jgi:hypothetical protein
MGELLGVGDFDLVGEGGRLQGSQLGYSWGCLEYVKFYKLASFGIQNLIYYSFLLPSVLV